MLPLKIQAARTRLEKERPYLATALWNIVPVEKPGIGTFAVDMWWRMYYDPAVLEVWDVEETAGVLYHEIEHLLLDHAERLKGVEPTLANYGADAAVNDGILKEGVKLPGNPITPEGFGLPSGKTAEEYVEMFRNILPPEEENTDGSGVDAGDTGKDGDGGGDDAGEDSGETGKDGDGEREDAGEDESEKNSGGDDAGENKNSRSESDESPDREDGNGRSGGAGEDDGDTGAGKGGPGDAGGGEGRGKGNGKATLRKPAPGAGRCGSCATGRPEPWEDPAPDEGGPEGVSPIQAELIRRMVATKIQEASKTRGDVPAGWRRWAEEILRPKIDWRKELAAAIRSALSTVSGAVDYSRSVPSRRQSAYGRVIMPALRRPDPNVAVVVDTSGSVSDEEVGRAIAETGGIIEAAGLREGVRVLSVDAEVHATQRVFRPDQIELYGGGGTNMARGIEAAERLRPQPDVIVVITDGYTPWPDTPPRKVKVIVVLTVRENEKFVPGWAKTIVVE